MKATGIIRRVDELGRVVIPKELRKIIGIEDDKDCFEIFIDNSCIYLKKHISGEFSVCLTRKVDRLGRIVIPKEIRTAFEIVDNRDSFEIFVDENAIVLKKYLNVCVFCGANENLNEYMSFRVCDRCKENISNL